MARKDAEGGPPVEDMASLEQAVDVDSDAGRLGGAPRDVAGRAKGWPVVDADADGNPLRRGDGSSLDGLPTPPEGRMPVPLDEPRGGSAGSSMNRYKGPFENSEARYLRQGEQRSGQPRPAGTLDGAVFVPSLSQVVLERAYADKHAKAVDEPEPEPEKPDEVRFLAQLAPDQICPVCGGPLFEIDRRIERRLERVHHHFEIQRVRRGLFDCPSCRFGPSIPAAWPAYITDAVPAGNGLLASVVIGRFHDHMALQNQEVVHGLIGVNMRHRRVAAELSRVADLARPIWEAMRPTRGEVRVEGPVPTRTPASPAPRVGALWTLDDGEHVVFLHAETGADPLAAGGPTRSGDGDAMATVIRARSGLGRLGLLAELRRRFLVAATARLSESMRALHRLTALDLSLGTGDTSALAPVGAWLCSEAEAFGSPTDLFEAAVRYGNDHWGAIEGDEPARDGDLNATWALEPWEGGADAAVVWHSLIHSCWRYGADPWLYVRDLMDALSDDPRVDAGSWTPAAWRARARRSG